MKKVGFITSVWMLCCLAEVLALQPENVVLYLPFDRAPTKGVIKDQSEYGNHGKLIGKAKWAKNGKFGGGMEFDGAFKIEVPHAKSLDLKQAMILQIWFRTKLPQKGRFLIYKVHLGGGRNYEWEIYLTGGSKSVSMYLVEPNDQVRWISKNGDWENNE